MSLFFLALSRRRAPKLVIARSVFRRKYASTKLSLLFVENERRSNLLSLISWQEVFRQLYKSHPTSHQSKEIASGIQQCLIKLASSTFPTAPRNDEGQRERRKSQLSQKTYGDPHLVIEGNIYA